MPNPDGGLAIGDDISATVQGDALVGNCLWHGHLIFFLLITCRNGGDII